MPNAKPTLDDLSKVIKPIAENLGSLADRWQDESQYEDINDYRKVIEKRLPSDFKIDQMTKRPFGFRFTFRGSKGSISVNRRGINMSLAA